MAGAGVGHRKRPAGRSPRLNDRLGASIGQSLLEQVDLTASPPAAQHRHDRLSLVLDELGIGVIRLEADGPSEPRVGERTKRLKKNGRRFLIPVIGRPSAELAASLKAEPGGFLGLEAILAEDELRGWRSAPPALPVPVRLAPSGARTDGQRHGCGFATDELDRLTDLDLKDDVAFAGIVVRLRPDQPVFATLLRTVAAVSARELALGIDLEQPGAAPDHSPGETPDRVPEWRAAEAAFAANALPDAEIVLGSLLESEPGSGFGLVDRTLRLTPAGRAVRTINGLPRLRPGGFAWSLRQPHGWELHGYESGFGVELLLVPPTPTISLGRRLALETLRLPVEAGAGGRALIVQLGGQAQAAARWHRRGCPRTISLEPTPGAERPTIIRLS